MPRSVYCSYPTLDRIIKHKEQLAPFYALITDHDHIITLDLSQEEFANKKLEVAALKQKFGITIEAIPGFLENLPFKDKKGAGSAIFILEEGQEALAKAIRSYGVCVVLVGDAGAIEKVQKHFYWQLEKGVHYLGHRNGREPGSWQYIIEKAGRFPLNALVIIDNYMLRDVVTERDGGKYYAHSDILDMLFALLPTRQHDDLPFQILLIATPKGGLHIKPEPFAVIQQLVQSTKEYLVKALKKRVEYRIELEIIFHSNDSSDFHRRVVITNYHFLRIDHGVQTFRNNRARMHNDISIEGAFRNLGASSCHMPWKSMALELQSIKSILSKGSGILITGQCNNRLLELVAQPRQPVDPWRRA